MRMVVIEKTSYKICNELSTDVCGGAAAKGSESPATRSGRGANLGMNEVGSSFKDKSPQQRGNAGNSSHVRMPRKADNSEPANAACAGGIRWKAWEKSKPIASPMPAKQE